MQSSDLVGVDNLTALAKALDNDIERNTVHKGHHVVVNALRLAVFMDRNDAAMMKS